MQTNPKYHTPYKKNKDKKNSTRVCTIESTSTKDYPSNKYLHSNNQTTKKPLILTQLNSKTTTKIKSVKKYKNSTQKISNNDSITKISKKQKKPAMQKYSKQIIKNLMQNQIEIRESDNSDMNTTLSSLMREIKIQEDSQEYMGNNKQYANVCESVCTNQLINQIFQSRKNRMHNVLDCDKTSIAPASKQKQIKQQNQMNQQLQYRYSKLIPSALKNIHKIPHLSMNKVNIRSPKQEDKINTDKLIKQSKNRWQYMHTKLSKYIEKCYEDSDMSDKLTKILFKNNRYKQIQYQLLKQGEYNYRWFQFLENFDSKQIQNLQNYSQINNNQKQQKLKSNQQQNKENGHDSQTQQVKDIEQQTDKNKLEDDQGKIGNVSNMQIQQLETYPEKQTIYNDENIGAMLEKNYNSETYAWKNDIDFSSGSEEDILNNSDLLKQHGNGTYTSVCQKQSDQSSVLRIDYAQMNEQDQLLEQNTDIVLNRLIDQFVIQLASQLNLDLFLGLDEDHRNAHVNQKKQSIILNNRIQQMFHDCQQIQRYCEDAQVQYYISDALDEVYQQLYNPKRADKIDGKYSERVKQALKRVIITRKDIQSLESERKRQQEYLVEQIKFELAEDIMIDIINQETFTCYQSLLVDNISY